MANEFTSVVPHKAQLRMLARVIRAGMASLGDLSPEEFRAAQVLSDILAVERENTVEFRFYEHPLEN